MSLVVGGQEITTDDHVGLKVSATVSYDIGDAKKATHSVVHYYSELYTLCQLALREELSMRPSDDILQTQRGLGEALTARVAPLAEEFGLHVHSIQIRDLMFSNDLKRTFNDVLKAKKEAEAKLERARGETAALRHLANAAKMLDDNPNLLSLRLVQAMENSQGHDFHLDAKTFKSDSERS
jgi:regulator of protease activity HflC (stomatin/prohibitin superfamily)